MNGASRGAENLRGFRELREHREPLSHSPYKASNSKRHLVTYKKDAANLELGIPVLPVPYANEVGHT
ncbi:hypothetical protein OUZ56_002063 [Daphnia magna]|uniref:Uncharacterized protein n=1 Tax=Daphnia magna TaxID=35525 RepID=A0ABR0A4K7_9CRUS|nr:hypothetical protein OUZ56_002063 [Daphnia magna]